MAESLSAGCYMYLTSDHLIFIGPESDHWECLSLTHSLTHSLTDCRLVNLIDVTLACEDGNSKLVEVVTVFVDDENNTDEAQGLVKILKLKLKLKFMQDFEAGVCSAFCC